MREPVSPPPWAGSSTMMVRLKGRRGAGAMGCGGCGWFGCGLWGGGCGVESCWVWLRSLHDWVRDGEVRWRRVVGRGCRSWRDADDGCRSCGCAAMRCVSRARRSMPRSAEAVAANGQRCRAKVRVVGLSGSREVRR